jgi:hypothetical protein
MRYFCTYFDRNFIFQGLALYDSLRDHAGEFTLWVLCFDETTFELLNRLNLTGLRTIRLEDFESANPDLAQVKAGRSFLEYYWTTTPLLVLYVLNLEPDVDLIAYLDADLFFYSNVEPIFQELGNGSIYIIPHRYGLQSIHSDEEHTKENFPAGIYNVSYTAFRRDDSGLACLQRWGRQCLDWCYFSQEPGRCGDQKYLDDWPEEFPDVVVSQNHGVGAGGWNLLHYRISKKNGLIYLNNVPLVMLHLNFIELLSSHCFAGISRWYLTPLYKPYAKALRAAMQTIQQIEPEFHPRYACIPFWLCLAKLIRGGIVFL